MKPAFILRLSLVVAACALSFMSYRYLNQAKGQLLSAHLPHATLAQPDSSQQQSTPDAAKRDTAPADESYQPSALPDVELLKFVIQKSREGIPVLNIDRWIPW